MQVELKLTDEFDAQVLRNLFPLYLHDISEFDDIETNLKGVIGCDDNEVPNHERPVDAWCIAGPICPRSSPPRVSSS